MLMYLTGHDNPFIIFQAYTTQQFQYFAKDVCHHIKSSSNRLFLNNQYNDTL